MIMFRMECGFLVSIKNEDFRGRWGVLTMDEARLIYQWGVRYMYFKKFNCVPRFAVIDLQHLDKPRDCLGH